MKSIPAETRSFEFCFLELDYTLVKVEESSGEVTIRATADTFSRHRKMCFIRELAAEGFIPDDYRWFPLAGVDSYSRGVRWVVDYSWLKIDEELVARTQHHVRRFILPVTALWLLMIYLAYPHASGTAAARGPNRAPAGSNMYRILSRSP